MRSFPLRVLASLSILILCAACVTGCASAPPIVAAPLACSSLIPSSHRAPVPGAVLPAAPLTAGALAIFADAQTAQLDKANGHTRDAIEIVEACEKRDQATMARLQAPWWKRLLGSPHV